MEGLKTGRMVYYVAYGTPAGEFPAGVERAAIVTEVPTIGDADPVYADKLVIDEQGTQTTIGVMVANPTGLFFNRGVKYDPSGKPGTWHWMFPGQSSRYIPDRMEAAAATFRPPYDGGSIGDQSSANSAAPPAPNPPGSLGSGLPETGGGPDSGR